MKLNLILNKLQDEKELNKETNIDPGISLDNAAYFESTMNHDETHTEQEPEEVVIEDISVYEEKSNNIPEADASQDEDIPQLFSDEENS